MGKVYIDTVKYMIHGKLHIDGIVEKPDVIGAVFGQTEGLLGDELDLRDLQKNGRIGRVDIEIENGTGKTIGRILFPSSMDMVETCILAAALETVDKVGPFDAKLTVERIEDTRNVKRKYVVDRAKELLKQLIHDELPERKEISQLVSEDVKTAGVVEYGKDKLTAGPGIDISNEVIIVEGRADVINLLKNDITNVIAIGGAEVPDTIVKLAKEKESTLFLDGDRGGDMILKGILNATEVDFVCRAPPGKEVEELTRKELIKSLRRKIPLEQAQAKDLYAYYQKSKREDVDDTPEKPAERVERAERVVKEEKPEIKHERKEEIKIVEKVVEKIEKVEPEKVESQVVEDKYIEQLKKSLGEIAGKLQSRIYNKKGEVAQEVAVRDLIKVLSETNDPIKAVVLDGIITQRLADIAETKGISYLIGIKQGNIYRMPKDVHIIW